MKNYDTKPTNNNNNNNNNNNKKPHPTRKAWVTKLVVP